MPVGPFVGNTKTVDQPSPIANLPSWRCSCSIAHALKQASCRALTQCHSREFLRIGLPWQPLAVSFAKATKSTSNSGGQDTAREMLLTATLNPQTSISCSLKKTSKIGFGPIAGQTKFAGPAWEGKLEVQPRPWVGGYNSQGRHNLEEIHAFSPRQFHSSKTAANLSKQASTCDP